MSATATIERSPGLPITVGGLPTHYLAGGGYRGLTDSLDETVQQAAETLRAAYGMNVTIRFNSDRKSGSAFLVTDEGDTYGTNAEIGIGASVWFHDETEKQRYLDSLSSRFGADTDTELVNALSERALRAEPGQVVVHAHIGARALTDKSLATGHLGDPVRGYYHGPADSIEAALAFVQAHGSLERVAQWQALQGVGRFLVAGGKTMRAAPSTRRRRAR